MSEPIRCKSPLCIKNEEGIRGRLFEPPKNAEGIATQWCSTCIKLSTQIQFFATQTIEMIRKRWSVYEKTELPKEVKLFMTQFCRELINELGGEL
jgi:hypothetical protein